MFWAQYLNFISKKSVSRKIAVFRNLAHKANKYCTNGAALPLDKGKMVTIYVGQKYFFRALFIILYKSHKFY